MAYDATSWSWVGTDQDEADDLLALSDSSRSGQTSGDYGHSWSATFDGTCSSLSTEAPEAELLSLRRNLLRSSDLFDDIDPQQNSRCTTFEGVETVEEAAELLRCTPKSREIVDDNDLKNTKRQTDRRSTPVAARQPEADETALEGMVDRRPSRIPRRIRRQAPLVVRPPDTSGHSQPSIRQPPRTVIGGVQVLPVVRPSQNGPNAYTHRPFIAVDRRQLRPVHVNTNTSTAVRQPTVEVLARGRTAKTAPNSSENAGKDLRLPPVAPRRVQGAPNDTKTKFAAVKLPSVHHVVSDAARRSQRPANRDVIELRALEPSMTSGQPVRDIYTRRSELLKRHGRLPPL